MTVGIAGLGLIGGSLARAYHAAGHRVLGIDMNQAVVGFAQVAGVLAGELTPDTLPQCDLVLVALYPDAAIAYMREAAPRLRQDAFLIDCCGTKEKVCEAGFALAKEYGFTFLGGHPMAGTQFSGFKASREDLFQGATMVIVPPRYDDIALLEKVQDMLKPAGFKEISVTTAKEHDRLIAFTSQLAHVVSNAYVKSPTAKGHRGLSAGSYRDLTRVAWLNPDMWTPLFLENRAHLAQEIDGLVEQLQKYRDALDNQDAAALRALLQEGRACKEEIDGEQE